jgi:hypothetical protein
VLEELAREAKAWGVTDLLCLDVEENVAEAMGIQRQKVATAWTVACKAHGFEPWTYGGVTWHADTVGKGRRWLASWVGGTPSGIPPGYDAWQYAGNVEGGRIDLDLFATDRTYMSTVIPEPQPKEPPVADLTTPEIAAVLSAIDAQVASVKGALADGNLAAAQATGAELTTHIAELNTLLVAHSGTVEAATVEAPVATDAVEPAPPTEATDLTEITSQLAALSETVAALTALVTPKS